MESLEPILFFRFPSMEPADSTKRWNGSLRYFPLFSPLSFFISFNIQAPFYTDYSHSITLEYIIHHHFSSWPYILLSIPEIPILNLTSLAASYWSVLLLEEGNPARECKLKREQPVLLWHIIESNTKEFSTANICRISDNHKHPGWLPMHNITLAWNKSFDYVSPCPFGTWNERRLKAFN